MKKIIYSIALGALTLTNTSCYDVLDKEPLDQYTDAVVWNDPTSKHGGCIIYHDRGIHILSNQKCIN